MSIYNARKMVIINVDYLPLHHQIKTKRIHDGLTQEALGKILRLQPSTISLIETGQRLIPKNRYKELERYLYESWYVDGELLNHFPSEDDLDDDDGAEEMMNIEDQRAYWKEIFDKEPDMWGTVL
ncbi:helix-turn-helix domain-containing protein [Paenibacillus ihuae]|uniref:helix-turn-helix domain-containing protein n=1 Tax=Paenibacillus ihuae TaxID=1232431 RepID=UPI001ADEF96C|nr:helix-turn-helix transcriptional regulator [Paenibacillus ihuae]